MESRMENDKESLTADSVDHVDENKAVKEVNDDAFQNAQNCCAAKSVPSENPAGEIHCPEHIGNPEKAQKWINRRQVVIVASFVVIILLIFAGLFLWPKYFNRQADNQDVQGAFSFEENTDYNGYKFYKGNDGSWYTHIKVSGRNNSHMVELKYSPWDVEEIPVGDGVKDMLAGAKKVYFSVDPDLTGRTVVGMINLGRVLGTRYDIYNKETKGALAREPEGYYDPSIPIIACNDSNSEDVVIMFRIADTTESFIEDSCVIVQGNSEEDLRKAADRVTYSLLNIME